MDGQPLKLRDDDKAGLDVIRDIVTCEVVADSLKLRGRGPARFCPRCARSGTDGVATLMLGTRYFECSNCYFRGDVVDLVVGAKKCTPDEAIEMLTTLSLDLRRIAREKEHSKTTQESLQARVLAASDDAEREVLARMAFMEGCRPLKDQVYDLLQQQGVSREVAEHARLRYAPDDAPSLFKKLEASFGRQTLLQAGLLQPLGTAFTDNSLDVEIAASNPNAPLQKVFEPYDDAQIRYLAIPYYDLNQLLYIKAIPLTSGKLLAQRKLPRTMGTAPIAPCPFNAEAISHSGKLVIFRQELDCMAALTAGYSAIAVPSLSRFQPGLVPLLNNRDVYICADEDLAKTKILHQIDTIFVSNGAPPPKQIIRKNSEQLTDVLKRELADPLDSADSLLVETQISSSGLSRLAGDEDVVAAADAAAELAKQKRYEIQVTEKLRIVVTPIMEEGKEVVFVRFQRRTLLGSWEDQEWGRIRIDPKNVPDVATAMVRLAEVIS